MGRLVGAHELLDGPLDPQSLAGNLDDLTRVNHSLGGAELSWRALLVALGRRGPASLRMLDVGTGAADIPRHLLRRANSAGLTLAVTAIDPRAEIVDEATRRSAGTRLDLLVAAPGRLPFDDASFHIAHASLVLHHLEPSEAVPLLKEMGRVASLAVIVNDLDRARRWWIAAWVLSRLTSTNRYTRHDAPLSVQRAYRANELSGLAAAAGLREVGRVQGLLGHRYALVFSALAPGR